MLLRILICLCVIFFSIYSTTNALEPSDENVVEHIERWLGEDTKIEGLKRDQFDFSCDGKDDLVLSRKNPDDDINGAHILLLFISEHNNRTEAVPHLVYYAPKSQMTNHLCGKKVDDYSIEKVSIHISEIEKSIKDRQYCNVGVKVLTNDCKSYPLSYATFPGPNGPAMTLIHRQNQK